MQLIWFELLFVSLMKAIVLNAFREPMLHFLVIGAVLFAVFNLRNDTTQDQSDQIVVTAGHVDQLEAGFKRSWSRAPTDQEREALISEYIRSEVFYREAVKLGLDQGDGVIRRRLRQKLEFILEDVSALVPPTDDDLRQYLEDNAEKFRLEPRLSFQHIYLSPEKRDDIGADALSILARVEAGEDPWQLGDTIMLPLAVEGASLSQIDREFGDGFARALDRVPLGHWGGPVQSGFGGHLVFVSERVKGRLPDLDDIRAKVAQDWLRAQKQDLEDKTYQTLRTGYEIIIEPTEDDQSARQVTQ
ncbi:peptidylprolyl isomerase (plasmid) [Aliisedimentitalea scapharcae]|uniref:Parvulin-like PPIase n=1 Tax=Aliisedimentitalea scapharcae TaxID=1524259 RepID=A0ABZ2Y2S3_9RHOB